MKQDFFKIDNGLLLFDASGQILLRIFATSGVDMTVDRFRAVVRYTGFPVDGGRTAGVYEICCECLGVRLGHKNMQLEFRFDSPEMTEASLTFDRLEISIKGIDFRMKATDKIYVTYYAAEKNRSVMPEIKSHAKSKPQDSIYSTKFPKPKPVQCCQACQPQVILSRA